MPVWEGVYKSSSEEKKLMKEHPEYSQRSINLGYLAGAITLSFFFPRNYHNNNGDAFRHCFWSSIIAKEVSPEWAHTWVMAHEADASPTNIYRLMDEYNNNQGINNFKNNPNVTVEELINLCLKLVESGELREVKKGKLVPTTLDGFNVPNIFSVISEKINEVVRFIARFHPRHALEKDQDGNTALHRCIIDDYEEGFNILVKILDANQPGMDDLSPLMLCSSKSNGYKYARVLIERGANADYQDPYEGETALMKAAVYGNREMVNLLLPVANKRIESFSGLTAYDMAVTEENLALAELLI